MVNGDYVVADAANTVVFSPQDAWPSLMTRLAVFNIAPASLEDLVGLFLKERPELLVGRNVENWLRFQATDLGLEPLSSTIIHRVVSTYSLDGCWRRRADDDQADTIITPSALITGQLPEFVFHGTSDFRLPAIRQNGLSVAAPPNWEKGGRDHVYLAAEPQVSAFHARRTADLHTGSPIVLKCRLPKTWVPDHDVQRMVVNPAIPSNNGVFLAQEAGLFASPADILPSEILEIRRPAYHTSYATWIKV